MATIMKTIFLSILLASSVRSFTPARFSSSLQKRRSIHLFSSSLSSEPESKINDVSIEYCTGCRWGMRSAWMAQELLTTFQEELNSITIIPSRCEDGGVFVVRLGDSHVVWDRKLDGGFPEMKKLKQRVRDVITPEKDLGHSDSKDLPKDPLVMSGPINVKPEPNVSFRYCKNHRSLLRTSWLAQDLLATLKDDLNSVTLIPVFQDNEDNFVVETKGGRIIWDRKTTGRLPEPEELTELIRGSTTSDSSQSNDTPNLEEMDDEDAEELRKYFGVM